MSGIQNLGLHCFANTTMQCMAHVPGILHILEQHYFVHKDQGIEIWFRSRIQFIFLLLFTSILHKYTSQVFDKSTFVHNYPQIIRDFV